MTRRSHLRSMLVRLAAALAAMLLCALCARAGDPKYVAGSSYFNAATMGQPILWPNGVVDYYTDQGDLSPIYPQAAANALVANSFAQWTAVTSAALTVSAAGQLAEDVNGTNIVVDANGTVAAPADITPSATQTPIGIVYDYDGSVTDALLGAGAGDSSQCFWNAVFGGADNFSTAANFSHALVVLNGQCALTTSQSTDMEYRLVRVLGSVLGLGWSQNNLNVITGKPHPTSDDYAGFPVMHFTDPPNCIPITLCYASPYQVSADDAAALSRLYPAAPSHNMARIHGSVYFVDHTGEMAQPMQGVNVVARWIDPTTGLASHRYSAASVSGFLFTGNAGNPITGWADPLGVAYSQFGSTDPSLEGFFDLGGLPIPNGASTAQYQLTAETLDPQWSAGVCPYDTAQVAPSGGWTPMTVTVAAGGDFEQDILMAGSAQPVPAWSTPGTWTAPTPVLASGDWVGSLSGYGDVGYYLLNAQANRTLSIAVTALDESSTPSESKANPVIGMWTSGDPQGTVPPAFTPDPFNSGEFATSILNVQVLTGESFIIGISDLRGDGRPDYHYHAHILYADAVNPPRVPVSGGPITVTGTGLAPGQSISIGSAGVPLLASSAGQMLVTAPAQGDGPQSITVTDPGSGASSTMTNALTYGAAATDLLTLLQGGNPPTAVGTQAVNPVVVRVLASDGVTAVSGATIGWTTTNGATLSACVQTSSCSTTDESGFASRWVTPTATGTSSIIATLAPGVYSPPQSKTATVSATSSSLDIGLTPANVRIAQGATLSVPLTAHVVSLGVPQSGETVNFVIHQGSATLSAPSAITNSSGDAKVTLTVTNFSAEVQLSACVAPAGAPCQNLYAYAASTALLNLQAVSGAGQVVAGTMFQPVTVRVTDSATPPDPVLGATVTFQATVMRPPASGTVSGDPGSSPTGEPVILSLTQTAVLSDSNGLASFTPTVATFTGTLQVDLQISAGAGALPPMMLQVFPAGENESGSSGRKTWPVRIPLPPYQREAKIRRLPVTPAEENVP